MAVYASPETFRIRTDTLGAQRLSLYVVDWQNRRLNMKGYWSRAEEFPRTMERLNAYLVDGYQFDRTQEIRGEYVTRMYRIVNLLDAVYMGWKDKELNTPHQQAFLGYKTRCGSQYHDLLSVYQINERTRSTKWAWATVTDVTTMRTSWDLLSANEQKAITRDLVQRFKNTVRRAAARFHNEDPVAITLRDRPELYWFIERVAPEAAAGLMQWSQTYHII